MIDTQLVHKLILKVPMEPFGVGDPDGGRALAAIVAGMRLVLPERVLIEVESATAPVPSVSWQLTGPDGGGGASLSVSVVARLNGLLTRLVALEVARLDGSREGPLFAGRAPGELVMNTGALARSLRERTERDLAAAKAEYGLLHDRWRKHIVGLGRALAMLDACSDALGERPARRRPLTEEETDGVDVPDDVRVLEDAETGADRMGTLAIRMHDELAALLMDAAARGFAVVALTGMVGVAFEQVEKLDRRLKAVGRLDQLVATEVGRGVSLGLLTLGAEDGGDAGVDPVPGVAGG